MFGLFPSVWFLARDHHREFLAFFLKVLRSLHVYIGGKHNVSDCGLPECTGPGPSSTLADNSILNRLRTNN